MDVSNKPRHKDGKWKPDPTNYLKNKEKIARLLTYRATIPEISRELGIGYRTAVRWRKKFIHEEGQLSEDKKRQIKEEFLAQLKEEDRIVSRELFKQLKSNEESKQKTAAIKALAGYRRMISDIYSKYGINPPEPKVTEVRARVWKEKDLYKLYVDDEDDSIGDDSDGDDDEDDDEEKED